MEEFIQQLNIYLKGGQVLSVNFRVEKAEKLNTQIDAFFKALGDKDSSGKNFLFQGQRPVIVRLSDVSAADVVSLVRKEKAEVKAEPSA